MNENSLLKNFNRATLAKVILGGSMLELLSLSIPVCTFILLSNLRSESSHVLWFVAGGFLLMVVLEALQKLNHGNRLDNFSSSVDTSMMTPALEHLFSLPVKYFNENRQGGVASVFRGISSMRELLASSSINLVINTMFVVVLLALMSYFSVILTLVCAAAMPIQVVITWYFSGRVNRSSQHWRESHLHYESLVTEALSCMSTIKAAALEGYWQERITAAHTKLVDAATISKRIANRQQTITTFVQRTALFAVILTGAYLLSINALSFGEFFVCFVLTMRLLGSSMGVYSVWSGLVRANYTMQEIETFLQEDTEKKSASRFLDFPEDLRLQIKNLSFKYEESTEHVLRDINVNFTPGSLTGIIGESGSGKSTLANLLQRQVNSPKGTITLGDIVIDQIDPVQYRESVCLVSHNDALFKGSIKDNLTVGNQSITEEELASACSAVNAIDFINEMPEKFESNLGERSSEISSGQRQRLVLARALLRKPKILIMDEATNALDSATETKVLRQLRLALPGTTIILITHRPNLLTEADHLFELGEQRLTPVSASDPRLTQSEAVLTV